MNVLWRSKIFVGPVQQLGFNPNPVRPAHLYLGKVRGIFREFGIPDGFKITTLTMERIADGFDGFVFHTSTVAHHFH
tara:strand:+ start:68 stop:298 length:231 start_codon:yes stop_codon:yes gene_type:complete